MPLGLMEIPKIVLYISQMRVKIPSKRKLAIFQDTLNKIVVYKIH
jgi:hypothetical protein